MNFIKKINGFWKFFIIYTAVLLIALVAFLAYVNSLLLQFEASQPERVVEQQILLIKEAAKNGELEKVLPIDRVKEHLGSENYPESFVKCFAENDITFEQAVGSFGAESTDYHIVSDGKKLATVELESFNERTEMIVFTCADWKLKGVYPEVFEKSFAVPSSIIVSVNGIVQNGEKLENGDKTYTLSLLGDADVVLTDMFGNTERQLNSVRKNFYGKKFTVPSSFDVQCDFEIPDEAVTTERIKEFEYVEKYTEMPKLVTFDIKAIPTLNDVYPKISIRDNLGSNVDFKFGDALTVTKLSSQKEVPEELLSEANVLDFAQKWSLFMTNDLPGGLGVLSKYLLKDSYIYSVAYKWATGIDRTFTSIHSLYNPPFTDEKIYNFIKYSDDCFSCDVYLVKKMRIANGLDVDDELSRKLFFVKLDNTNNSKDDPKWYVADMLGADPISE